MDNHLHFLLRINVEQASQRSVLEVARRWMALYPPRGSDRKPLKVTNDFLKLKADNAVWVAATRKRLSSLGWFMKCLKEPLARMANKQDGCAGAFFEGCYKSIAILDEEALLSVCAYINLNPVAAVTAEVESIFTRLGSSAESWGARLLKLSGARLLGRFLSASRGRLREIGQRIGVRHLVNVG